MKHSPIVQLRYLRKTISWFLTILKCKKSFY
jgi:hypothetical protein